MVLIVVLIVLILEGLTLNRLKADATLAKFPAPENLGQQFVPFAENETLSNSDLTAGPHQAFPIVGFGRELVRQQNLNASMKQIAARSVLRAASLTSAAFASAIEPRRKDAGVVEDHQIAGAQEVRQVAELAVGTAATRSLQLQHPRAVAGRKRLLGNQFVRQMKMKVRDQHALRL